MKTKRSLLNFITDVVPLVIVSVLGIFKLKIFIRVLGNETLGLYQLFSQIMIYIALVDGGITNAVLYHLYKPNSDGDSKKLNNILAASKHSFNKIGIIVFSIAFVVSFFIKLFIKNCSFGMGYLMIVFLLFSLSNVVQYFFVPYQVLLEVKEKKYLTNICLQTGQILLSVLEIVMLLTGFSFISVLIMHAVVKLLSNVCVAVICKKQFPNISYKSKTPDYSYRRQIKDLMVHKVNGLISSNIDVLIISKIMGLGAVAIYSIYNYIINMLKNILGKISSSIVAIIGNKNAKDGEKIFDIYKELNSLLFLIAICICVPLLLAINGFIDIWYERTIATSSLIAIAFCSLLFVYITKLATTTFITSTGLFKETKICAYCDIVINLSLSLILVHYIKISGVIFATAISQTICEYVMKSVILFKNIFHQNVLKYLLGNLKYLIIVGIDLAISYLIITHIAINSIVTWFGVFLVYTIINSLFILLIFYVIGELHSLSRIAKLVKRGS